MERNENELKVPRRGEVGARIFRHLHTAILQMWALVHVKSNRPIGGKVLRERRTLSGSHCPFKDKVLRKSYSCW